MCGQRRHHHGGHGHHGECGCHEGGHKRHHEDGECDCGRGEACECGCQEGGHAHEGGCHEGGHEAGCECSCHAGAGRSEIHFQRQFATRAERVAALEQYLKDLQAEAKGVEERIAEMKTVGA